jgi:hypothetical protein
MAYDWKKHSLSYVKGPAKAGALIAVRPERLPVLEGKKQVGEVIAWFDHDHRRVFDLKKVVRDDVAVFEFVDTMDRRFTLRPMDLDAYNKHVRPEIPDARGFKSEADLRRFFMKEVYRQPMEL